MTRLILRRQLKSRYPDPWKPGGKTLDEWRAVCTERTRFSDLAPGQYFVVGVSVARKKSETSYVRLFDDTSEVLRAAVYVEWTCLVEPPKAVPTEVAA